MLLYWCLMMCSAHRKAITANVCIVFFLVGYALFGGFVFLHFEHEYAMFTRQQTMVARAACIRHLLASNRSLLRLEESVISTSIASSCLHDEDGDFRHSWSFKTAALYGFGILSTLGYGKIEPRTTNGRIFAVIYGFFGIPITVILLTNLGRYLERLALKISGLFVKREEDEEGTVTPSMLLFMVLLYVLGGALFVPFLNGRFDFFNGIYFAFICLTAIEYGDLVPQNDYYIPIIIIYVCIGLAISTIALDIGSIYVRKLHYLGKKIKNIANIRIWFGGKDLRVSELVNAVGHNIGLRQAIINDIDLDNLVQAAIRVKEGRLIGIPQTHVIDGIWPPALVPLFIKDGTFPLFVDQPDEHPRKPVVRFDLTHKDIRKEQQDSWTPEDFPLLPPDAPDAPPPPNHLPPDTLFIPPRQ